MPFVTVGMGRTYYRLEGCAGKPVLIFSHSLGCDHGMWDQQTAALLPYFRVLRYDTRGHGASDAPPGEYTMEQLGRDVLEMSEALGIGQFAFCGLSLGGMIGQWLGANAGDRLTHLVLANTSARFPDPGVMETRRRTVLESGMSSVATSAMERFFSPERQSCLTESIRQTLLTTNRNGYAGCCAAIRDMDQTPVLANIRVPVLLIVGSRDISTPWAGHGETLAAALPHAKIVRLNAAHLSNIELPRTFSAALLDFLLEKDTDGGAVRRAVLGDEHVDRSIANTTEFNREFQELITKFAWGSIWTRPGLDRRTRRLLVLAITAAMGRSEEFALHVRTGLQHELEPCDLKEVLLQLAIYAGVPAANTAFRLAGELMQASEQ
ncbi:MAG: 3-oxoadipate enol-lactonase [Candidatus Solibacter usitatus]|nr:3-oxoadipate enol-lactonase [Candidatus Solibacter usitatus]